MTRLASRQARIVAVITAGDGLHDAQVALADLEDLQSPRADDAARALRRLFDRHGCRQLAVVLEAWSRP
jgi:hypothetical protein